MSAQSWIIVVKAENVKGQEQLSVFAPNPDNAKQQIENRGYQEISVRPGYFFQNVNSSAEFKNI